MLEDLAVRLICVLCLDRFVDFVGDQAVIPVRETCAQALAVVLEHCSPTLCLDVMQKALLVMVHYQSLVSGSQKSGNGGVEQKWAVRHAALIGIKYWMAVRQDLLDRILVHDSPAFLAIVEGYC
jgi:TATA-binding protein-associated factor